MVHLINVHQKIVPHDIVHQHTEHQNMRRQKSMPQYLRMGHLPICPDASNTCPTLRANIYLSLTLCAWGQGIWQGHFGGGYLAEHFEAWGQGIWQGILKPRYGHTLPKQAHRVGPASSKTGASGCTTMPNSVSIELPSASVTLRKMAERP